MSGEESGALFFLCISTFKPNTFLIDFRFKKLGQIDPKHNLQSCSQLVYTSMLAGRQNGTSNDRAEPHVQQAILRFPMLIISFTATLYSPPY